MLLSGCKLIEFPKIADVRGNLSFIEGNRHIPFSIQRVYYLYDIPAFAERGGHAHKKLQQILIPLTGSFKVHLDNGKEKMTLGLNKPWEGLFISQMVWRELSDFSSGSSCLVLASELYEEQDYYRDYQAFLKALTI